MILFYTLLDIGFKRFFLRFAFEIRKRLEKNIPSQFLLFLIMRRSKYPEWADALQTMSSCNLSYPFSSQQKPKALTFNFLNECRSLSWPIVWENRKWSRLWQFNLHYFDWARNWLENALSKGNWPQDAENLELLIDHWIKTNPLGHGDGWHSYTLSLRIRNWIWLFRCCPSIPNTFRLRSLWQQLCWLESHPENHNGGNHWLENLIAIAIGSLQFKGKRPLRMYRRAIGLLEKELEKQILSDGGHEERSASYHILVLDRIVELGFVIQDVFNERPEWLIRKVKLMCDWTLKIRLSNGSFPIFNDSARDSCSDLDIVLSFAQEYLYGLPRDKNTLRGLIGYSPNEGNNCIDINDQTNDQPSLIDLPQTGWTILRPNEKWELFFKSGVSSPKHIAAHAHSDILSFNLFKRGKPFFIEAGTSIYEKGFIRNYERSALAHNMLQLALIKRKLIDEQINWIEPVEVWDSFRAGRKAEPLMRKSGKSDNGSLWTKGSHNVYRRLGVDHQRNLELTVENSNQTWFRLSDQVQCEDSMYWRQIWHLGPDQSDLIFPEIIKQIKQDHSCKYDIYTTSFSEKFGKRIQRKTLCFLGILNPGRHILNVELLLPS